MIFGIDPGTHTGLALWDAKAQAFLDVQALPVHRALEKVRGVLLSDPSIPVIFEDARQRQWFGRMDEQARKYGNAVREGAGAAKRDATIWEDFLEDLGTPYIARAPASGSTKWPAEKFARLTQWKERTNEHGRDAGVLVYGFTLGEIASVIRSWNQARANKASSTSACR